jgi:hypothetical protein
MKSIYEMGIRFARGTERCFEADAEGRPMSDVLPTDGASVSGSLLDRPVATAADVAGIETAFAPLLGTVQDVMLVQGEASVALERPRGAFAVRDAVR